MVSSGSFVMLRAMMIVALLTLNNTNVVCGQNQCKDDQDCSSKQYCYNVSSICVNFTQCERYNRKEAAVPARQPSQCGSCLSGYKAEILGSEEPDPLCKQIKVLQKSASELENVDNWTGLCIGGAVIVLIVISIALALKTKKCTITTVSASGRFFEKVSFLTKPTAPPQDDASYRLRGPTYPEEEQPPVYASVIRTNIDKDQLVNAVPSVPPGWVRKPPYESDYNDNVDDGIAIPIHSSSTNLQMEVDDEGETNPSSWTPGQVTVNLPARPFALFSNSEQQDNALNNVLVQGNCSSHSHEQSSSDNSSGIPEEPSRSRMHGDVYCGPNVQINQMITLNIAKNGTK